MFLRVYRIIEKSIQLKIFIMKKRKFLYKKTKIN